MDKSKEKMRMYMDEFIVFGSDDLEFWFDNLWNNYKCDGTLPSLYDYQNHIWNQVIRYTPNKDYDGDNNDWIKEVLMYGWRDMNLYETLDWFVENNIDDLCIIKKDEVQ